MLLVTTRFVCGFIVVEFYRDLLLRTPGDGVTRVDNILPRCTTSSSVPSSVQAHANDLSIGLKNDIPHLEDLEPYFDWALNECEFSIVCSRCVDWNRLLLALVCTAVAWHTLSLIPPTYYFIFFTPPFDDVPFARPIISLWLHPVVLCVEINPNTSRFLRVSPLRTHSWGEIQTHESDEGNT